jgi:hypothetical protein
MVRARGNSTCVRHGCKFRLRQRDLEPPSSGFLPWALALTGAASNGVRAFVTLPFPQ